MLMLRAFFRSAQPKERPRESFTDERLNWEPPQVVLENHPRESRVTEDILFLDFEHVVYGRSDAVWSLDEQSWINFRRYRFLFYTTFLAADGGHD